MSSSSASATTVNAVAASSNSIPIKCLTDNCTVLETLTAPFYRGFCPSCAETESDEDNDVVFQTPLPRVARPRAMTAPTPLPPSLPQYDGLPPPPLLFSDPEEEENEEEESKLSFNFERPVLRRTDSEVPDDGYVNLRSKKRPRPSAFEPPAAEKKKSSDIKSFVDKCCLPPGLAKPSARAMRMLKAATLDQQGKKNDTQTPPPAPPALPAPPAPSAPRAPPALSIPTYNFALPPPAAPMLRPPYASQSCRLSTENPHCAARNRNIYTLLALMQSQHREFISNWNAIRATPNEFKFELLDQLFMRHRQDVDTSYRRFKDVMIDTFHM